MSAKLIGKESLLRAIDKKREEANEGVKSVYFTLLSKVIVETPVDEGRARNNWFFTIDKPASKSKTRNRKSKRGADSLNSLKFPDDIFDTKIYLTNNLPYIARLEYGGWSDEKPEGWVRSAIQDARGLIKQL